MAGLQAHFHASIREIDEDAWRRLWRSDNPFIRYDFLAALEDSACVAGDTGWQPQHLVLYRGDRMVAAMPLYLKHHSQGEFVFDWSWAEAYRQHGIPYYPKLLTAIPFTPSAGPRVAFAKNTNPGQAWQALLSAITGRIEEQGLSGWHLLFAGEAPQTGDGQRLLERNDVQFHWHNRGYRHFDHFLATLRSGRRKNLRRERRGVHDRGIVIERNTGSEINEAQWDHFYQCYCHTYLKRSGHSGYLSRPFFDALLRDMPEQLMLVTARRGERALASALFLFDSECLYGRYWGALEPVRSLHFECCFYQGMEFCIERDIARFDPGTQGEHKLLRGFEPVKTRSWHLIAEPRFRDAIARFLEQEKAGVDAYALEVAEYLPFRKDLET